MDREPSGQYPASPSSSTSSRRLRIPDKPKSTTLSFWGFLKSCIGKDLSQLSLPVNFNEPLSLLQRLTEELEYSELMDKAASCTCQYEQAAYLAAFIVSGYSSSNRITKPFDPLLGETFEFDRLSDLGWRIISEQVSLQPPTMAFHCDGNGWTLHQEFSFETKFTGNDIQVTPTGEARIEFQQGASFRWKKIMTTVHNFIIGGVWVDHQGTMEIIGKKDEENCVCTLEFIPHTGLSLRRIKSDTRKVRGEVRDSKRRPRWKIEGNCDGQLEIQPIGVDSEEGESTVAWKGSDLPEGSENYYNFSMFACQLNEFEEDVAPTDSRRRPDQRLMEEGRWEEANVQKTRLEEKQRETIKGLSGKEDEETTGYRPTWFRRVQREDGSIAHEFNGDYWTCKELKDWSRCPDIF